VQNYKIGDSVSVDINGKIIKSVIVNIERIFRPTDTGGKIVSEMHGDPNSYVIDLETGHWARGNQIVAMGG